MEIWRYGEMEMGQFSWAPHRHSRCLVRRRRLSVRVKSSQAGPNTRVATSRVLLARTERAARQRSSGCLEDTGATCT